MSSPLPLDLIEWSDLRSLKQSLDQGDQKVRDSVRRIVHPVFNRSVYYDDKVLMHTLRMLAACHDHRSYITACLDSEYYESDAVLGLRRFTYNGSVLNWESIRHNDDALSYAKALVAVTNLLWAVVTSSPLHPLAAAIQAENEEVWIASKGLIDLVHRHHRDIEVLLAVIDERNEIDTSEIERMLANGALSSGTL